jgi:putative ABC transport system permease protein
MDQVPNDLALLDAENMLARLQGLYPDMDWAARIQFGGLVDAPDERERQRHRGRRSGLAWIFFPPVSREAERLGLAGALVRGVMPATGPGKC